MRKYLYAVRHGEATHNVLFKEVGMMTFFDENYYDTELTDKGFNQAQDLGNKWLDKTKMDLVIVSPLSRTLQTAVNIFKNKGCHFELMHCVSTYPMKDSDANLKTITTLRQRFNCNVGYSGHESGLAISFAAVALGATSVERHITLNRAMYGSDQAASLAPPGLKKIVPEVRKIQKALGDGVKKVLEDEIPIAKKLRERLK